MSTKKVSRWKIMRTAAAEIGYVEGGGRDGRSGNITKYWADRYPAWQGSAWCGAFVDWVLAQHGADGNPIGRNGIFYTPSIVAAAKSKGVWRSDSSASLSKIKPGDLVLFDFNGSGYAKHVGFAEKYLGGGRVQTIEGNTSPTNAGSQNNGGGVYRRTRTAATIMGYVDMDAWLTAKTSTTTSSQTALRKEWKAKKIAVHGYLSVGTIKRLQAEVGVTIDGQLGPITRKAVQRWVGVTADGIWGPKTYAGIRRKIDATNKTGGWTTDLCRALQRWLNAHRG